MKTPIDNLLNDEQELLYKSPLLVCILIAGADGKIDDKEIRETLEAVREHHWVKSLLTDLYRDIANDFEDKFSVILQSYPSDPASRNALIAAELAGLNHLWSRLGGDFSAAYVETLRYLAERIASSSGRFWRRIGPEEARLVKLPMIAVA